MEATELQWHEAQRRQSELTALSQALMLLIGALAVMLMLWMASGGVGGNTQPGALIALFVFCALAAFEALAPVTGAFQHLGQVIASALRITELTGKTGGDLSAGRNSRAGKGHTHPTGHFVSLSRPAD